MRSLEAAFGDEALEGQGELRAVGPLEHVDALHRADGILHVGPPKSMAGRRSLPLPETVALILAQHLAREGLSESDTEVHLLRAVKGGPLRYTWWHQRVWVPAREAIGRPGIGFHDLRRLYASGLVGAGLDVKVSQELMGHEDIRLTRGLYAQAATELKRAANRAMEEGK